MKTLTIQQMASKVYWEDPDYFETVDFGFLEEAVENTKNETEMELADYNIGEYADYIKEYLI